MHEVFSTIDSWLVFLLLWLQWTQIPNLPAPDMGNTCQSAVHRGWLYIITHSKSAGVVLYRTRNKRDWEEIPSPPNAEYCHSMLSHNSRLFILSKPPSSVDRDQHLTNCLKSTAASNGALFQTQGVLSSNGTQRFSVSATHLTGRRTIRDQPMADGAQ